MRAVVLCLGAAAMLCCASTASAQPPLPTPPAPNPHVRVEVPRVRTTNQVRRPVTEAQQLIYERAAQRAQLREMRLETKKAAGFSPSRPDYERTGVPAAGYRYILAPSGFYYYGHPYLPY